MSGASFHQMANTIAQHTTRAPGPEDDVFGPGATTSEQTPGSLDTLGNYRKELHGCMRRRADALFELTDAM